MGAGSGDSGWPLRAKLLPFHCSIYVTPLPELFLKFTVTYLSSFQVTLPGDQSGAGDFLPKTNGKEMVIIFFYPKTS